MAVPRLDALRIELFADGADLGQLRRMSADPLIRGFTTNPTLMRKAGVPNYEAFAREAAEVTEGRPLSLEVFSDDFDEMEAHARKIAGWGPNVFVKIPVTDTRGRSSAVVIRRLSQDGIKINATALATVEQVRVVAAALDPDVPAFISVFAGRIADTGRDPVPLVREALEVAAPLPECRLIWASPRELLNIFQADSVGCHVITMTSDLLAKLGLIGKDLTEFSLETVRMFYDDARAAGYELAATAMPVGAPGGEGTT
jgi:transaldolase